MFGVLEREDTWALDISWDCPFAKESACVLKCDFRIIDSKW